MDTDQRLQNWFSWFIKWVLERQTFKTLSRDSALSIDTLQRIFYTFLDQSPTIKMLKGSNIHLRVDAMCFEQFCLVCYQNNDDGYTPIIRFTDGEHFTEIKEDLDNLIKLGLRIESITTDGHKSILQAIKKSLPDVAVQRCLVHMQRMCMLRLTWFPKQKAAVKLSAIELLLPKIKTANDRIAWIKQLEQWHLQHIDYIQEKTVNAQTGRYRYTHKLLRRSYFFIKRALPNMFHYLANPAISATTNGRKGFFSHLKNHHDLHRGLTKKHRITFIKWNVYLSNDK